MLVPVSLPSIGQIELVSCAWYSRGSDSEAPVLELWGKLSIPSLPLLPGPLWSGVLVPN